MDMFGIHVPRVNGDIVHQSDLYPEISSMIFDDSSKWFNCTDPISLDTPDLLDGESESTQSGAQTPEAIPGNVIPSRLSSFSDTTVRNSFVDPESSVVTTKETKENAFICADFHGFVKQKSWFFTSWVPTKILCREKKLYIQTCFAEIPPFKTYYSVISNVALQTVQREKDCVSFQCGDASISIRLMSHEEAQSFVDALKRAISSGKDRFSKVLKEGKTAMHINKVRALEGSDPLQLESWPTRCLVLDGDGFLKIYTSFKDFRNGLSPTAYLDLGELIALDEVPVLPSSCPSGVVRNSQTLPVYIFKLVFKKSCYLFSTRLYSDLQAWISILKQLVAKYQFSPSSLNIAERSPIFSVKLHVSPTTPSWCHLHSQSELCLTVYQDRCIYFKGQFDCEAPVTLLGKDILWISQPDENAVQVYTSSNREITHLFSSSINASNFFDTIKLLKRRMTNYFRDFGLHEMEFSVQELRKPASESVTIFDPDRLKGCTILFRVKDKYGIDFLPPRKNSVSEEFSYVVLCGEQVIYHLEGNTSSRISRARVLDISTRLRKFLNLKPQVVLIEPTDLRLKDQFMGSLLEYESDDVKDLDCRARTEIFEINSEASREENIITLVTCSFQPTKSLLDTKKVYVISYQNLFFSWSGKESKSKDRLYGKILAKRISEKHGHPGLLAYCDQDREFPLFYVTLLALLSLRILNN
jgi:hypothetical protein